MNNKKAYGKDHTRHRDIVKYYIHAFVAPEKEKRKNKAETILTETIAESFKKKLIRNIKPRI